MANTGDSIGLGTSTPNAKLEVTGAGSGLSLNVSGDLFVNDSTGNVGIGTASPTDSVLHLFRRTASDGLLKIQNSPSSGSCPAGMSYINKQGGYCIDNYEAVALNSDGSWHEESDNQEWRNTGTNSTATLLAAGGKAGSIPGKYPWVYIKQTEARTACENAGKHLCTSDEWMGAVNINGDLYDLDETISACTVSTNCISGNNLGPNGGDACYGGNMTGCVSSEGVYDMVGNVWEWTNETVDAINPNDPAGSADWFYINSTDLTYSTSSSADDGTYGDDGTYFPTTAGGTGRAVLRGGSWSYGADAGPFCAYLAVAPSFTSYSLGFRCCSS